MNTFRIISRVFAVATVVVVSSVSAECPFKSLANHKATVGAIAFSTALPKDADAAKAAVQTLGVALDNKATSAHDLALNFAANFVARKVGRCLKKNGYKMPEVSDSSTAVNHVVPTVTEALSAAAPQVVASLVVMAVHAATAKS